jgi:hypothetical protein
MWSKPSTHKHAVVPNRVQSMLVKGATQAVLVIRTIKDDNNICYVAYN